jgi:MFS family permease
MQTNSRYRWFVVVVFFIFMLLHQSDKLLIGPLTTPIMETFGIDEVQMGAVFTGALLVGAFLYPLWGYLYDRYTRSKLLALASFIWGSTTWLSAIAPTFPTFVVTRATTGIDDSSYPGMYSLISDYFGPGMRGKVYGILQLAQPLGYMIGLLAATLLSGVLGWRGVFYITGSLGLVLAVVIFFGVKEAPRGGAEPEMAGLDQVGVYKFDRKIAAGLFRKRSLLLLFAQGFVGVFPWQVITYWFFRYLETERFYDAQQVPSATGSLSTPRAAGFSLPCLVCSLVQSCFPSPWQSRLKTRPFSW